MAGIVTGRRYSLDQIASEVEIPVTTIRNWIRRGYMKASYGSGRSRYFTTEHRDRLLHIKMMKEQQRTLADIADHLDDARGFFR